MVVQNNIVIGFILVPIVIGICLFLFLLVARKGASKRGELPLRSYVISYGICVATSIFVFMTTLITPILFLAFYIIIFVPFMHVSAMLNKRIIVDTRSSNGVVNLLYKLIVTIAIWFMALFPFSLLGVTELISIPSMHAQKQEITQWQEEILHAETYADLTPFDLGIYKLQNEGNCYLWDITEQGSGLTTHHVRESGYEGMGEYTRMVYGVCENRKYDTVWDDYHRGRDVVYNVYLYEGTYIIVTPTKYDNFDTPVIHIYLCKELSDTTDLFQVTVDDEAVLTKLNTLSADTFTRSEMVEKLGKKIWEDVPKQ